MIARSFRELRTYQLARDGAGQVFAMTKRFPAEERYSLTDQIRRASRAVKAILAEAWARRRYKAAFMNKIDEALAEAMETQSWLDDALDCGYIDKSLHEKLDELCAFTERRTTPDLPGPEGLWEEEDRLLANLKFGLLLGGEVGVRKLREKLGSGVVREQPQSRQLSRSVGVGEVLERFRDELGLKEEEWAELRKPVRRRRRPLRDVLIYVAWRGSHQTLGAVGEYYGVGYTTIANARTRGEAHLQKDRKLRQKPGKLLP